MHHSSVEVATRTKPFRVLLAAAQVVAIVSAFAGAVGPMRAGATATSASDAAAATQISGVVFRDYNNNGIMDGGSAVDTGVAGVEVRAFAPGVAQSAASAQTDGAGAYVLSGLNAGIPYRIEFGRLPTGAHHAPHGNPGASTHSGTSVQFAIAGAAQVNLGINTPCEYCQDNPWVVLPVQRNGQPVAGTILGSYAGMFAFPYSATRTSTQQITMTYLSSIGSVWGVAYLRESRTLLTSAFAKRHAGLGPLGISGIYAIKLNDARAPAPGPVRPFVKLSDLGVDVGVSPRAPGDLPIAAGSPNRDGGMFDAVGKIGIGGIDTSLDGHTVWVVNLKERTLVRLTNDGAGVTLAGTIPMPASVVCARGMLRPFAVKAHLAHVYVGAVCTAESGGDATQLRGYVFRHDPAGALDNMSTVLSFPLDYIRGAAIDRTTISASWNPWIDAWLDIPDPTRGPNNAYTIFPQPILSSITFDSDGNMVIGLMDRMANQGGNVNYSPLPTDAGLYSTVSVGDVLRACPGNSPGAYVLESNGACGGVRGGPAATGQGPGGGEYYFADGYFESHDEVALGGLAMLPGARDIGVVAVNPDESQSEGTVFQQGVRWMSHTTGAATRAFQLRGIGGYNNISVFGKASGLGDAELLCDPPPIEIGNRVWFDANGDGIQDAGETPLAGVTVVLTLADGSTHTAVTDALGEYFFSTAHNGSLPHAQYDIPIRAGSPFTLSVNASQAPVAGFELTTPNADGLTGNDPVNDVRDSDAIARTDGYEITGLAGGAGENNHSYDIGLRPLISPPPTVIPPTPTPIPTLMPPTPTPYDAGLGDFVWLDSDRDGRQGANEEPISGITVTLLATRTTVARDAGTMLSKVVIAGRRRTDERGFYEFRALEPGTPYLVCFSIPHGLAWTLPETDIGDALGSDVDALTSCTKEVKLDFNEYNPKIDAGLTPGVGIQKAGATSNRDGTVGVDNLITYTLRVWNMTSYRINDVVITDALSSALRYVPGSASTAPNTESPLTWIFPTLRPSETVTLTFVTAVVDPNTPAIRNIAYVSQYTKPVTSDSSTVVRNPTLIQLDRFRATAINGGVRLNWRTLAEANTLGFHLYRGTTSARVTATRITSEMLLGANATGGDYVYEDTSPLADAEVYYWLEETELGGRTIDYGPVRVAPVDATLRSVETGVSPIASAPQTLTQMAQTTPDAVSTPAPEQVAPQAVAAGRAIALATATPAAPVTAVTATDMPAAQSPWVTTSEPQTSHIAGPPSPQPGPAAVPAARQDPVGQRVPSPVTTPAVAIHEQPEQPGQAVAAVIQNQSGAAPRLLSGADARARQQSSLITPPLAGSLLTLLFVLSAVAASAVFKLTRMRK